MADESRDVPNQSGSDEASTEKLKWEKPELLVEDIDQVTRGGPHSVAGKTDDAYYS